MAHSHFDEDSRDAADDHWIFEELGSPVKSRRMRSSTAHEASSQAKKSPTKNVDKNEFDEKLQIYANNMRKLIITARKEIKNLKEENITLNRKLESSGLIECPACLFRFKPQKEHRVLPKYMKLAAAENGKDNLVSTGSLLPHLVKERYEKSKSEKVVISTRPVEKGPDKSVNDGTHLERKCHHDRKVSSEIPSTSQSPDSTLKQRHSGDYKRNRNASDDDRDRSLKSISSDEYRVNSRTSSEPRKKEAGSLMVIEQPDRGDEGAFATTEGRRGSHQRQHIKTREKDHRRLEDSNSIDNRSPLNPAKSLEKCFIPDKKPAERAIRKTSREMGKENLHHESHSSRAKDQKEDLYKENCLDHEKKRKSLDYQKNHRSKGESTSDENGRPRKTSMHNALRDGSTHEHGKERRKGEDDRARSRNSKDDNIKDDSRRHHHSHLSSDVSSHPSDVSHKRSSASKEKTVATDRCKREDGSRKHDHRHSPTRGVGMRKRSLREVHEHTHRSDERHSHGHVRKDSDNRSHQTSQKITSERSNHHRIGRDSRKRSRSREQPRKRAGKEVLRDVFPDIKRRCSSPRRVEHPVDEIQHSSSKMSSPDTQNLVKIELESPLSPDEYSCSMSDADLVIVDEEEVEDGEILE